MRAIVPEFLRSVGENAGRAIGDVWNGSWSCDNALEGIPADHDRQDERHRSRFRAYLADLVWGKAWYVARPS
jgi:hypothetical protein